MSLVNRSLAIVRPRQPYLDWMAEVGDEAEARGLFDEIQADPTAYLIPECDDLEGADEILHECWPFLFDNELHAWMVDEATWPPERSLELFLEWFEVEVRSTVIDLCEWELSRDPGDEV